MSEPPRIIRLDEEKIPEAAAVMARAFHEDPLWLYVVPDLAERARVTLQVFIRYLRFGHLHGDVYGTEGKLEGVSVWLSPEPQQLPTRQGQPSGWGEIPSILGPDAFGRLVTVLRYEREIHDRDLPEPHWYLMQLGVDPPSQRKGLGGLLIRPGLERALAQRMSCYLETEQPRNVQFYLKRGFKLIIEVAEPKTGVRFWTFRIDP